MTYTIAILAALLSFLSPGTILAQLVDPLCSFAGCGMAPANILVGAAIPRIAAIFLNAIAALSVIFVIVGGSRMILSFGKEEERTKGAKSIIWALAGVVLALTSHRMVTVVVSQIYVTGGDPVFEFFATVVQIMILLLNVVFLIIVLLSGMRMVVARGKEEEVTKGRKALMYAIAGIIIINVAPYLVKSVIAI
jgi:hypothetical protein